MVSIILLQIEIIVSQNSVSLLSQAGKHLNIPRYWVKANWRNIIEDNHNSTPLCVHVKIIAVHFMTISQQRCNEFILPLTLRVGAGGCHIATSRSHIHVCSCWKKQKQQKKCVLFPANPDHLLFACGVHQPTQYVLRQTIIIHQ